MRFFFLIFLLIVSSDLLAESSLQKKYPDGLLTDDFGILKESDLVYDIKKGNPRKYEIEKNQSGYYRWQCFPIKNVKLNYSTWKENDPQGTANEITNLYDYHLSVRGVPYNHIYYARRAVNYYSFWKFYKEWKQTIRGEKYVCFNGEPDEPTGREKYWFWNKIQTKKRCMSLFVGHCETSGYVLDRGV